MDMPRAQRTEVIATAYRASPESSHSAVSWAAIISGAVVAAAVSLILVALGSSWGLSVVSPWTGGPSATTFTVMTAIWLIITQWLAAAFGGYLTGRLRTQWVAIHTHEVFFRDTAHGFITWALATLLTAALLVSGGSSVVSGGARLAGTAAASGSYDTDVLLRGGPAGAGGDGGTDARADVTRLAAHALATPGGLSAEDRSYLAAQVAARSGVSQAEAQARVDTFFAHAKAAADSARKAAAATALFTALSMLVGAFIACVAAALGGRERDQSAATT
jgi:hypothetical protein